jgi:hypothetical protein
MPRKYLLTEIQILHAIVHSPAFARKRDVFIKLIERKINRELNLPLKSSLEIPVFIVGTVTDKGLTVTDRTLQDYFDSLLLSFNLDPKDSYVANIIKEAIFLDRIPKTPTRQKLKFIVDCSNKKTKLLLELNQSMSSDDYSEAFEVAKEIFGGNVRSSSDYNIKLIKPTRGNPINFGAEEWLQKSNKSGFKFYLDLYYLFITYREKNSKASKKPSYKEVFDNESFRKDLDSLKKRHSFSSKLDDDTCIRYIQRFNSNLKHLNLI